MAAGWSDADRALFTRAPLYGALPPASREDLLHRCHARHLTRGEVLFHQGDLAENLYMVLSGWIKVYRMSADGTETVLHIFHAGETFAEPAAFGLGRYPATAEAAAAARVMVVPAGVLMAEVDQVPGLAMRIIATLSQRLHGLIGETERRHALSTTQRVGAFLIDCAPCREIPNAPIDFDLPYDKALVAARLGMTPESFSRALAKLKPYGVQSKNSRITLDNVQTLKDFCEQ